MGRKSLDCGQITFGPCRYHEVMPSGPSARRRWWALLAAVIAVGLVSRVGHTGLRVFDKHLGDALYAAMVYILLRLTGRVTRVATWAAVAMLAIELFQL